MIRKISALAAGAALLLIGGGAAPPTPRQGSASQCVAGERIVYSCAFGAKVVSVCANTTSIAYRYGPPAKPEIAITSNGRDGIAHQGDAVGGGGGSQTSLRFSKGPYSYIVYAATAGALTDIPGQHWSGVVVFKGGAQVSELQCRSKGTAQDLNLAKLPHFVPPDTDERFDMWF